MRFFQRSIDPCIYYWEGTVFLCYVDDSIIISPMADDINTMIKELQANYNVMDKVELDDYLGVKIQWQSNDIITLTQPHLIESILKDIHMDSPNTSTKPYPAATTILLHKDPKGEDHNATWSYRSFNGRIILLEKSTRPDIAYAVLQCARFSSNLKKLHTKAVIHLCSYLACTKDKELQIKPNNDSKQCWVDSDFCGLWNRDWAEYNKMTAWLQMGYFITYAGLPIIWNSKLQTEIPLISMEEEYIALSKALRQSIVIMNLLKECIQNDLLIKHSKAEIKCTAFKDNQEALKLAYTPKLQSQTQLINIKYHHFWQEVESGNIMLSKVNMVDQWADILTKPMEEKKFTRLREKVIRW